jgi:quercetin dioxygenase-like cupin family protein
MAKMTAIRRDEVDAGADYQAPRRATGVRSSRRLSPPGYSLWLCESELDDGGTITWSAPHGDDGVYVLDGSLQVDGRSVPRGGAVIVESDASAVATADGPVRLVHVGTTSDAAPVGGLLGPAGAAGHGVHVVGPGGRFLSGQREGVRAVWFADSTCDTCRIALFTVEAPGRKDGPAHHHSQDEIIFVLDGGISMGRSVYGPGSSLCIPGGTRYAFTGDPGGHVFLNFRADVSEQFNNRSQPGVRETALARGGHAVVDAQGSA